MQDGLGPSDQPEDQQGHWGRQGGKLQVCWKRLISSVCSHLTCVWANTILIDSLTFHFQKQPSKSETETAETDSGLLFHGFLVSDFNICSWTTSLRLKRCKWTSRRRRRKRRKRSPSLGCSGRSASGRERRARRRQAALHLLLHLHCFCLHLSFPHLLPLQLHLLHLLSLAHLYPKTPLSYRRQCPRWDFVQSELAPMKMKMLQDPILKRIRSFNKSLKKAQSFRLTRAKSKSVEKVGSRNNLHFMGNEICKLSDCRAGGWGDLFRTRNLV